MFRRLPASFRNVVSYLRFFDLECQLPEPGCSLKVLGMACVDVLHNVAFILHFASSGKEQPFDWASQTICWSLGSEWSDQVHEKSVPSIFLAYNSRRYLGIMLHFSNRSHQHLFRHSLISYRWSFGQIISVAVWVPSIIEYVYILYSNSTLPLRSSELLTLGQQMALRKLRNTDTHPLSRSWQISFSKPSTWLYWILRSDRIDRSPHLPLTWTTDLCYIHEQHSFSQWSILDQQGHVGESCTQALSVGRNYTKNARRKKAFGYKERPD